MSETPHGYKNSLSAGAWVASCHSSTRYKWLKARALLEYASEANDDDLDETACHEIVHTVLDPLDSVTCEVIDALPKNAQRGFEAYFSAALERTTTHLTHVLQLLDKR